MYQIWVYNNRIGKWVKDNLTSDYCTIMNRLFDMIKKDIDYHDSHMYKVMRKVSEVVHEVILYAHSFS